MRKARVTLMFEFNLDPNDYVPGITSEEMLDAEVATVLADIASDTEVKVAVVRKEVL